MISEFNHFHLKAYNHISTPELTFTFLRKHIISLPYKSAILLSYGNWQLLYCTLNIPHALYRQDIIFLH